MRTRDGRSVATFLATALLAICPWWAQGASEPDRTELRRLQERIEQLKQSIAGGEESRNEARDALRESEQAISEANRQLHALTRDRRAASQTLVQLERDTRQIERELAQRRETLARLLIGRLQNGEADALKLLISGTNPNEAARELHYYGYISRAQAEFIRSLRGSLARIDQLKERIRDQSAELARIEEGQKRERARLAREQAARRGVLDRVSARLREQRKQVQVLQRDEARLGRLIEELGKALAEQSQLNRARRRDTVSTPRPESRSPQADPGPRDTGINGPLVAFAALKGHLRMPVRGNLTGRFGSLRADGGPSWKGLFFRAPAGQEVRAVADGRVVFADWMRGFGNLLIVDHGEGYLTVYGNNEAVLKQVGEAVRGGEAVATTGTSGGGVDSGLYFEARHEGRPFDPLKWFSLKSF